MSYPESAACTSRPRLFFGPEGEAERQRYLGRPRAQAVSP